MSVISLFIKGWLGVRTRRLTIESTVGDDMRLCRSGRYYGTERQNKFSDHILGPSTCDKRHVPCGIREQCFRRNGNWRILKTVPILSDDLTPTYIPPCTVRPG